MSDHKDSSPNSPPEIGCLNEADKQRCAQEYPKSMSQLRYSAQIITDALKVFEASSSGIPPANEQDPRYQTLTDVFTDFMFDCNHQKLVQAEQRAADSNGSIDKVQAADYAINDVRDDIPGIRDLLKKGKQVSTSIVIELYDKQQPSHRSLIDGIPNKRAVRAVALCLATNLYPDGSSPSYQSMMRNSLKEDKVDTPWGNPIDVAQKMLKKSGFASKT